MKRREGFERLQEEIAREKAAALGRTGERLEAALDEVRILGLALDAESDPERRAERLREYEAARRRAATARTMLLIQREASGLRQRTVLQGVGRKFVDDHRQRRSCPLSDPHAGDRDADPTTERA